MTPIRYMVVAAVLLVSCTVGETRPPNTGGPDSQCAHYWDDNHLQHGAIDRVYLVNSSSFRADIGVWNHEGNPVTLKPAGPGFPIEVVDRGDETDDWLGLAEIWKLNGHIVRGRVSINMVLIRRAAARYSISIEQMILHIGWQEVGHIAGLGHQRGAPDSAMDDCVESTNWPKCISNPGATGFNAHDFEALRVIYAHVTGDPSPCDEVDGEVRVEVHAFPLEGADDHDH